MVTKYVNIYRRIIAWVAAMNGHLWSRSLITDAMWGIWYFSWLKTYHWSYLSQWSHHAWVYSATCAKWIIVHVCVIRRFAGMVSQLLQICWYFSAFTYISQNVAHDHDLSLHFHIIGLSYDSCIHNNNWLNCNNSTHTSKHP